jgi:hypothetical protein
MQGELLVGEMGEISDPASPSTRVRALRVFPDGYIQVVEGDRESLTPSTSPSRRSALQAIPQRSNDGTWHA